MQDRARIITGKILDGLARGIKIGGLMVAGGLLAAVLGGHYLAEALREGCHEIEGEDVNAVFAVHGVQPALPRTATVVQTQEDPLMSLPVPSVPAVHGGWLVCERGR